MKKLFSCLLLLSLFILLFSACSSDDNVSSGDDSTTQRYITDFMIRTDVGSGQVTLEWLADPGAKTYNIYYIQDKNNVYDSLHIPQYKTMKAGTKIEGCVSAPYTVSGLTKGKEYWFSISGVNPAGESYLGTPTSATTVNSADAVPPPAPANVRAHPGNEQVTITWVPVTASPAVTSYKIYCNWQEWQAGSYEFGIGQAITMNGQSSNLKVVDSIYWKDGQEDRQSLAGTTTALKNDRTYYFYLTAVSSAGESSPSFIVFSTPVSNPAPAAPTNFIATNSAPGLESGQIYLDWTEVTGATYNVYSGTAKNMSKNTQSLIASGGTEAGFLLSGLTPGTTYYFVVTAVNANGESAESIEVSMTPKE
ncbi:MAG: fibronectin type III domain-containing protein [Smithella sp.]